MNTAEQNFRLVQEIDASRRFLLMAYQQNPKLLERADARTKQMFEVDVSRATDEVSSVEMSKQRGVSMIELIMFIVIVSAAMVGILSVMNVTTAHSADPLLHKQAIAIAESLLEEIELQDFIDQNTLQTTCSTVLTKDRSAGYHTVSCYDKFSTTTGFTNNLLGLSGTYTANVSIDSTASPLGTIAAGYTGAVRITVTVTDPQGNQIAIDGYRTKY